MLLQNNGNNYNVISTTKNVMVLIIMKTTIKKTIVLLVTIYFIFVLIMTNFAGNLKLEISSTNRISNNHNYNIHAENRIWIAGNEALATFIQDKRLSGDGTATFPYIIENFLIDASSGNGIEIRDTDTNLIIRDCTIENGSGYYMGIFLYNTTNVTLSNNFLDAAAGAEGSGIYLHFSSNNMLFRNTANGNGGGIILQSSHNNTLSRNTVNHNTLGISLTSSNNCTLNTNNASFNTNYGINLEFSNHSILSRNDVNNNNRGIGLSFSSNNTLFRNNASYNDIQGIGLLSSSNNSLSENTINNNGIGMALSSSSNINSIYYNNIYGNINGQAFETSDCTGNQWDNGITGNYWGDDYVNNYPSASNDGRIWDIPYEINGDGSGIDNFPLVDVIVPPTSDIPILISPPDGAVLTDASPVLEWTEVSNTAYYVVQVDDTTPLSYPMVVDMDVNTNTNELSTLPNGTYYWRVNAVDTEGKGSPWSSVWTFTIAAEVPRLISPANGAFIKDNTPLLEWSEVSYPVAEYVIQVDNEAQFDWPRVVDVGVTTSSYETPPLADGTYYWRVNAVNTEGDNSPCSSVWSFTIGEETTTTEEITSSEETTTVEETTTPITLLTPGFEAISLISLVIAVGIKRYKRRK
jgi:parallel beta-helix repeat protein